MTDSEKHIITVSTKVNEYEERELLAFANRHRDPKTQPLLQQLPGDLVRRMLLWTARNQHIPVIAEEVQALRLYLKNMGPLLQSGTMTTQTADKLDSFVDGEKIVRAQDAHAAYEARK